MRVLLVANTLPPRDLSGAGEQVLQLAAGLRAGGHRVVVLGRGPQGAPGPKVLFPLTVLLPLFRTLKRFQPDVVQLHESDGGLAAVALHLLKGWGLKRWRRHLFVTSLLQVSYREEVKAVRPLHDRSSGEILARPTGREWRFRHLRAPLQIVLGRWTGRSSSVVFAPSLKTADELRRDYGLRNVCRLPNVTGADLVLASCRNGEISQPLAGAQTRPEDAGAYLLYVGRLRIRKGVEVLLRAMSSALAGCPDLKLKIAGSGERLDLLAEMVDRSELKNSVELLGRCTTSEVQALLESARALVVPSIYEGMPLVILEAMEKAKPVIATRVSGIPEVVVDGQTGWLVDPEDTEQLSSVLTEVWQEQVEARRRGIAGQQRLVDNYRPHHAAAIWSKHVNEAMGA